MLVDSAPAGSEEVDVYYGAVHTLDGTTSTLPMPLEDLVAMGAGAYAALEWSSFASNRINAGGEEAWKQYLTWGQDRMAAFTPPGRDGTQQHRPRALHIRTGLARPQPDHRLGAVAALLTPVIPDDIVLLGRVACSLSPSRIQ